MDRFHDNFLHTSIPVGGAGKKMMPVLESKLRKKIIAVPEECYEASGISILGKRIKTLLFSTDVALIKNTNADGIIAVYPFTPQPVISQSIINVAHCPVFCGCGGGITSGARSIDIALDAELHGAFGVVLNAPTPNVLIAEMKERIDSPIVITVISEKEDIEGRIHAGASIFNVSGGSQTAKIVARIRKLHPTFPIIATGGPTGESIKETIHAGANVITYTPPTSAELFSVIMDKYREQIIEPESK